MYNHGTVRFVGIVALLVGFVAILYAMIAFGSSVLFPDSSQHTTGTVVNYGAKLSRETGRRLIIEYTAAAGEKVRFQGGSFTTSDDKQLMDTVPVRYDPARPEAAVIDDGLLSMNLVTIIVAFVGIALIVFGATSLVQASKTRDTT